MADRDTLIPDPLTSSQSYCRYYHLGLEAFEDEEIIDEINYLRPFLWGEPPDSWLRQRVERLEGEFRRRQSNTRGQPKAKHAEGVKP